jgi:predicted phage-related endonuclease
MKMQRHHVPQGSDAWHALRNAPMTATASEAPAMMGCSPNVSRTELLNQKKTGITREFSDFVEERVFAQGHETEASFRPIAEEMTGDDLYPVTGSRLVDGITMLASFDGLTMDDRRGFEHKLFNADTAGCIAVEGEPPMHHVWQLEHQLLVCGGESILFVTSDGTETKCETCIYTSKPERRAQLIAGWKRFFSDLETHEVVAKTVKVEAEAVEALPAVSVRMDGQIIVSSNLDVFGKRLRAFVAGLNQKPETDQDFANADAAVKALDKAEKALEAAKASAIAQVESVEQMTTAVEALIALSKSTRLAMDKLVKARKEAIKVEVVTGAQKSLVNHIMALNARIGRPLMPRISADFGEAIKGKKSVDTLKSAAADELARAKTEADMMADRIIANLKVINETGLPQLFADLATLVVRDPADMAVLVEARVTTHKAAEEKRLDDERKRLKNEMLEQEIRGIEQQVQIAAIGRAGVRMGGTIECIRETLAETEAWPVTQEKFGDLTSVAASVKERVVGNIRTMLEKKEAAAAAKPAQIEPQQSSQNEADELDRPREYTLATAPPSHQTIAAPAPALAPNVTPITHQQQTLIPGHQRTAANDQPEDDGVRIKLGDLNALIAPMSITADGLATLGYPPVSTGGSAKLYRECDVPAIVQTMVRHLNACMAKRLLAA